MDVTNAGSKPSAIWSVSPMSQHQPDGGLREGNVRSAHEGAPRNLTGINASDLR